MALHISKSGTQPVETTQPKGLREVPAEPTNYCYTEKDIENHFKAIFNNYGMEYSFDKLLQILGSDYSKEKILQLSPLELENTKTLAETLLKSVKEGNNANVLKPKQKNIATTTGWKIEEFEKANKEYQEIDKNCSIKEQIIQLYAKQNGGKTVDYNEIPKDFKIKQFGLILANSSDEEKLKLTDFVIEEFKDNAQLLKLFFESFDDKTKATACADSIDTNKLFQDDNGYLLKAVAKYMSVPGTNKLFKDYKDSVLDFYTEHEELIDRVYKNNIPDEELNESELKIINKYRQKIGLGVKIISGAMSNKNFSNEDAEKFLTSAGSFYKEMPFYELYLEEMAKELSDKSNNFILDKDKLSEILNKTSDNKFSEYLSKYQQKTAIDEENGGYKTQSAEVVALAEQNKVAIEQEIAMNTPQEDTMPVIEGHTTDNTERTDNVTLFSGSLDFGVIKDIVTGKRKNVTNAEEYAALEEYKRLDSSAQSDIIERTTNKFFDEILRKSKTSALELINYCMCGDLTKKVKSTLEERRAQNA